jgi:hypothetical protein
LRDDIDACPTAFADTSDGCPPLPMYLGRLDLGEASSPDRYLPIGKPAGKPQRLSPYTHGADAVVRLRWEDWGETRAEAHGTARVVLAGGRRREFPGVRVLVSRVLDGQCSNQPAQFYTRVRVLWPKKMHRRQLSVLLAPGCGPE